MENVNKQLLDAASWAVAIFTDDSLSHERGSDEWLDDLKSAIAAAEQAPRWPQVDMGFGKFAVGSCTCAVTGVPGLLYLRLDEPRPHNTDCSDVFPVGSEAPEDRIASVIHFHSAQALQQTIDELLQIQREHYTAAEQAQQAEPVAWEVLNGVVSHDVYCSKADAEEVALDMQKAHDLSGSFAAFNVRPLYAQPPAVAVPDGVARAVEAVAAAIYFADSSDYLSALWDTLRFLSPEIAAIAESDTRAAWERAEQDRAMLAAAPQATAEDSSVVRDAVSVPDELTCEDIERLRLALSWEGYSTPEGLENCAARWPSLVRDLIAGVLDRKKHAQSAAQKGGE